MAEKLPRETVEAAYHYILGRAPEDDAAIAYHQGAASVDALRRRLLTSEEFAARYALLDHDVHAEAEADALPPALSVETEAPPEIAPKLWARVADAWEALGQTAPHWSVLTFDAYKPEALSAHRDAFERTRALDAGLIDRALARFPNRVASEMRALEIGCGVGRATRALAERFAEVEAVDISAAHLAVAEAELAAAGIHNVRLRRIGGIEACAELGPTDFLFSRLVFQHNPPPVQAAMLGTLLRRLAPGGIALFQVVTHIPGYAYRADDDVTGAGGMEMHVLPQVAVFRILGEAGCRPIEVQPDGAAIVDERLRAHLFLAERPA